MSIITNANKLKRIFRHPCATPGFTVMVETFISAGIPTLFELLTFSCLDIMKLRAGISYRCGRQLKAAVKAAHGPSVVDNGHFLYHFGPAIAERALWFWFVGEIASEFVLHWTSMMYAEQGCDLPRAKGGFWEINPNDANDSGLIVVGWLGPQQGQCATVGGGIISVQPGCEVVITYSVSGVPRFPDIWPNPTLITWLEDEDGEITGHRSFNTGEPGNQNTGVTDSSQKLSGGSLGRNFRVIATAANGVVFMNKGNLNVTAWGYATELIPAGCSLKHQNALIADFTGS